MKGISSKHKIFLFVRKKWGACDDVQY